MRPLLALLAGCVVSALLVTDAAACGNATMADVDANVKKVKAAEAALEKGDVATAKKTSLQVKRFLQNVELIVQDGKRTEDLRPLLRRATRIHTLAVSRDPKSTEAERNESVTEFERTVLGSLHAAGRQKEEPEKAEPTLLADHAEVLSRIPARTGPALMVLRTLRDKDLLGSAHAFAALARLEKAAGNADAEKDARERCRKAAVKPAICDE